MSAAGMDPSGPARPMQVHNVHLETPASALVNRGARWVGKFAILAGVDRDNQATLSAVAGPSIDVDREGAATHNVRAAPVPEPTPKDDRPAT